jgi:hypothetical protein
MPWRLKHLKLKCRHPKRRHPKCRHPKRRHPKRRHPKRRSSFLMTPLGKLISSKVVLLYLHKHRKAPPVLPSLD